MNSGKRVGVQFTDFGKCGDGFWMRDRGKTAPLGGGVGVGCGGARSYSRAIEFGGGHARKSIGEKKKPCKNCEGKGTLKKGDKIVRCQRCGGTGIKPS